MSRQANHREDWEELVAGQTPMAEAGPLQKIDAVAVAVLSSDTSPGIYQCTAQRCNCCQFMVKGVDQFHGTNPKKFYKIKQVLTCKSSSVIYIIECKKCKIQYVGRTKSFLKTRFSGHKNSIVKQEIQPIPYHFNNDGHSLEDLAIFPIEQVTDSGDLNERELYWISELETMEKGLNLVPFKCAKRQGRIEPPDQEPPEEANETLADESVCSDMGTSDQRDIIMRIIMKSKSILNRIFGQRQYFAVEPLGNSAKSLSESSRTSIKGNFSSFQEDFITSEQLSYKKEPEKYLRLVYIRTQQRKLLKDLEKEMLQRKKKIYNSLSDSICDTMRPTYQECSGISGTSSFTEIQRRLKSKIESSKKVMFNQAMREMLKQFGDLKEYLVKEIKTQMTTILRVALNQIPDDVTGLPDVSEEMEMMQRCCEALQLQIFK